MAAQVAVAAAPAVAKPLPAVSAPSVQLGDRPWDTTLGQFGNFNEPHYRSVGWWCVMGPVVLASTELLPHEIAWL